jgi:uncharacterized protein (UPF0276 family)
MPGIYQEFHRRASRIPFLGLGLSVDVYSPDIFELCEELRNQDISISYFEIFQAVPEALDVVRARLPGIPLAYHAEGLWFTQPDWETAYNSQERLEAVVRDLRILDAYWVNQECAAKEIRGFAFGTYLPPLLTGASAEVTAYHTGRAQQRLDQWNWEKQAESPLLLLEGPPLSYFSIGDISYAEFFAKVTARVPCGLVLDLGHVWTVYRYSGAWRTQSLESFCDVFFDQFPLERVVQIHIAGLECHSNIPNPVISEEEPCPPAWIDAHEAPIPEELLQVLARVVREPRLINLKGIALEVDNKGIALICQEVKTVREILKSVVYSEARKPVCSLELQDNKNPQVPHLEPSRETLNLLTRQYWQYVELATGKAGRGYLLPREWNKGEDEGVGCYARQYLPHEIVAWGGNVQVMFPQSCRLLDQHGVSLDQFVEFWFAHSRKSEPRYDFFILKAHLFVDFLGLVLPLAVSTAREEAELLSRAYDIACQVPPV